MSEMGIYSSLYADIQSLAQNVDAVVVRLRAGTSRPHDPDRRTLTEALAQVLEGSSGPPIIQLLRLRLRSSMAAWRGVLVALRSEAVDEQVLFQLEELARMLDHCTLGD